MTSLHKLASVLRSTLLPLALLLIALSTVFIFKGDRGYFYRRIDHNWMSSEHMTVALNISSEYGFQRFHHRAMDEDGTVGYVPYNRFPIGSYLLLKAAALLFGGDPSTQLYAARILMLLCFTAAVVVAYLSLCRLTSNRWIALTAALLAFSSYYLLYYNDMTAPEGMPDLFGVMLTFHAMVVFVQEGRFRQLLLKACIALLIGWHVLALLAPFVIFGLARDLWRARSAAASSTSFMSSRHIASALLRSRYLQLCGVALGFSLCVLTFNFTMEYIALDGETPLTELPSFQSMLRRTGADSDHNTVIAPYRDWSQFIEGQFRSIGRMFIPYSLLGSLRYNGPLIQSPTWLTEFQGAILGVALSAACLIGSMFVRPRILFATLASFGFFWALPFRHTTALHDFEPIYYIGLPLVFFAIALLFVRRVTNRDGVITAAAAAAAVLLFTISSFQMSRVGHSAEAAQRVRAGEQDILAIRELVGEEIVTVVPIGGHHVFFFDWAGHALNYYLHHRIIRYRDPPPRDRGFVLTQERVDIDALLTPQNQYFFLYDTAGLMDWYRSTYRSIVSTEPLARGDFDVYLIDGTVYYLKEPCYASDFTAGLFLHVFPAARDDLPNKRRQHGFDNLDFTFYDHGLLFDDKCLAGVDLPQYDIAGIRTGQSQGDVAWVSTHVVQGPKLISEYESIVSGEPIARSEFDVYFDGGTLYYVKGKCGGKDLREGFFLHVVPADLDDLPGDRKEYGFDNLDFGFDVRGVLFDGKCLAAVDLPQYGIARITTGQFDGVDRIWEVEFAPESSE